MQPTEDASAFISQHPGAGLSEADARWLLTLAAAPDRVLDLPGPDGRRALLAVLLEDLRNASDSAELVVLARSGAFDADRALSWAIDRARSGPRPRLDTLGPESGAFSAADLARHGFSEAYQTLTMEREAGDLASLPASASFTDLDRRLAPVVHGLVCRAFDGLPGANVAALEPWTERMLSLAPAMRVFFRGGRPVGFVRVAIDGEEGTIHSLGRDPDERGAGVGPLLVLEGLRLLAARGARRIKLEVTASNGPALRLYERSGFRTTLRTSAWRRDPA